MKCAETTAESVACLKTAVFNQTTQISDEGHHEADKTLGIEIFPLSEVVIFSLLQGRSKHSGSSGMGRTSFESQTTSSK